jgi:DNA-binding GntR family transcriptional regulator
MKHNRTPRTRVSDFPTIRVAVNPRTLEALEAEAEERALSVSAIVREALDRAVLTRAEGGLPLFLASNYFPAWVAEAVPQLAEESTSGLPKWLGQTYGPLYGEDLIDSRMPTPEERERLEIPENTPVTVVKGVNRDSQHRPLHYIVKVTVSGRWLYGYRFGIVPES